MGKDYICKLNPKTEREPVNFVNRCGLRVAGDLYIPKGMDRKAKHAALVVGAPYGGVKEQGPCVYGGEMAARGFVVLTFDQSFMGESEGEPRHVSSPDIFVENFSAAVDYLGLQQFVDREKIGVIGICGSGGFSLSAAQCDTRIKAVATCSMYDMSRAARAPQFGVTAEQIQKTKEKLSQQRWVDAERGYPEYVPYFPEQSLDAVPAGIPEPAAEWFRFYALKRGHHVNARGGFTTTSDLAFLNFNLLDHVDEIAPRPILMVVGDRAHSRFFSEEVYARAKEPKELYTVEDAEHIDLYDRKDRIPFEKLADFFTEAFQ